MEHQSDYAPLSFPRLLQVAAFVFCFSLITRAIYYTATEGFCLERVQTQLFLDTSFALPPPSQKIFSDLTAATSQPFYYLKKGSQAYAFISKDRKFVLKLFKYHHMQPGEWLLSLPLPSSLGSYRDDLVRRRRYKITLTLNSYKIAATALPDACALLYAQIRPTTTYTLPVRIFDAVGRSHIIDLSRHGFALQRSAKLVLPSLEDWIEHNQISKAKEALNSLVALIKHRSSLGIADVDPDLHKNAGLIGTSALFIDIGSFLMDERIKEPDAMKADAIKTFSKLIAWLQVRCPELAEHVTSALNNLMDTEDSPYSS